TDSDTSHELLKQAKLMEENGAQALVLECIPKELAKIITNELNIPIIGTAADTACNGQILDYHYLLQYVVNRLIIFVKSYANFNEVGVTGIESYVSEVRNKDFPKEPFTYQMKKIEDLPK